MTRALALLAGGLIGLVAGWVAVGPRVPDLAAHGALTDALLEAAAARYGVEPALLRAVAAVESGGDPAARSSAGAVGLMQLMPATAEELARQLGRDDAASLDLQDAATSLDLGAAHLARLLDRFEHHPELALAAYNAGAPRVAGWCADHEDLSAADVVRAEAPVETRLYVRRVLELRAIYARR